MNDRLLPMKKKPVRILVGICSSIKTRERREAVRETWLSHPQSNIDCLFFIGDDSPLEEPEQDVVVLRANDDYDHLPEKVLAFFRHALQYYDFDWLFKCDDDTYLDLSRLQSLIEPGIDFIGDESLDRRGSPSGGAGYFLSRTLVEKIVHHPDIPSTGAEDVIYGELAGKLNAVRKSTSRLRMGPYPFPMRDNNAVSAHWCPPDTLKALEVFRYREPIARYDAVHESWEDEILFYEQGFFRRNSTGCFGKYENGDDVLRLCWFLWPEEPVVPVEDFFIGSRLIMKINENSPGVLPHPAASKSKDSLLLVQYGCGSNLLEGWINLDLPHFNICSDLVWEDNTVDAIFLEHVIEHVSAPEAYSFFREAHRCLRKGGILRLAYPDIIRISQKCTPEYVAFLYRCGWGDGSEESAIGNIIVNHGHKTVWSIETLTVALNAVGFKVTPVKLGESEHSYMRNLESHGNQLGEDFNYIETECIEAKKI